jgi:hypothetical protein
MKVDWRVMLMSVGLFCLLYAPVIFSEIQTSGANAKSLVNVIFEKGNKDDKHNIAEKIFRSAQETSTYNFVVLTGNQSGGDNIRTKKTTTGYFLCDKDCKERLPVHVVAMSSLILISIVFLYPFIVSYKKRKESQIELNLYQRQLLIVLWLGIVNIFLVLMAYQISPRFYLLIVPVFLIMFGTVLQVLQKKFGRVGIGVSIVIVSCLLIFNLVSSWQYFTILNNVETRLIASLQWRDLIMKRADYITLGQLREVSRYISEEQNESKFLIVGDNRYARTLYFLTNIENGIDNAQCYIKRSSFETEQVDGKGYYVLVRTKSKVHIADEMLEIHNVVDKKNFGTLMLYRMSPKKINNMDIQIPNGCFVR